VEHGDVELRVSSSDHSAQEEEDATATDDHRQCIAPLRAHALVLSHASPVLAASLSSAMQEGQTRVVKVPGVTEAALQLLLSLIYTGSKPTGHQSHAPRSSGWAKGDYCEANWRSRGRWWSAQIEAIHDDGSCDVTYTGFGNYSEQHVSPWNMRASKVCSQSTYGATDTPIEQVQTQLLALDLAHRWQVDHAVSMLEKSLMQSLREGSDRRSWFNSPRDVAEHAQVFDSLCEAASLKELPLLRAECRHFASESAEIQRHWKSGLFSPAASKELQGLFDAGL